MRFAVSVTLQGLVAAALLGCGGGSLTLPLQIAALSPEVVPAGTATEVTLSGARLPSGAWSLALTRTLTLADESADDAPVRLSGVGDRFTVPAQLAPGVYDLGLMDGRVGAILPRALAVAPQPAIASLGPAQACAAQGATQLTAHATDLIVWPDAPPSLELFDASGATVATLTATPQGCSATATGFRAGVLACDTLVATLPAGQLGAASYSVGATALAGATAGARASLVLTAPPSLTALSPIAPRLCVGGGSLDLHGAHLSPAATVTLGGVAPDSTLVASSGDLQAAWSYSPALLAGASAALTLVNPDGCATSLPGGVAIAAGPVLVAAEPPLAFNGASTPVTVDVAGLTPPLGGVALVSQATGVAVPVTATVDAGGQVRFTLPAGLDAADYNLTLADASGCDATLLRAFHVVDQVHLLLLAVRPSSGAAADGGRVLVTADADVGALAPGARAYLAPTSGGVAVPLAATVESGGALSAMVPPGLAPASYDLVVVSATGSVGRLAAAYTSLAAPPPRIAAVWPAAISTACAGADCQITLDGSGLGAPSVSATCTAPGVATALAGLPALPVVSATSARVTVDAAALAAALPRGAQCTLSLTDTARAESPTAVADTAVLFAPTPLAVAAVADGGLLNFARRGAAAAVAQAAPGARFLYVIGGDAGTLASARADGEFAPLGAAGVGAFAPLPRSPLPARTLAGLVAVGRWLFLVGGHDGTRAVATVLRAAVLDPAEAPLPQAAAQRLDSHGKGLAANTYAYRVAALFDGSDPIDPGGETLAGPARVVTVRPLPVGVDVTVSWSGGAAAQPGRHVTGYRVYRGLAGAAPDHARTLPAAADHFTDDDSGWMAGAPLPLGALGRWSNAPSLSRPRAGAGVTVARDATTPGRAYLYAGFGWDSTATAPAALPSSYDWLQVDLGATGPSFTASAFQSASLGLSGRWLLGAFAATQQNSRAFAGSPGWIFFGQGTRALSLATVSAADQVLELDGAALDPMSSTSGGALTAPLSNLPTTATAYGYGGLALGDTLLLCAGAAATQRPGSAFASAPLSSATPPASAPFTADAVALPSGAFLPAVAADGAYLFLAGGAGPANFTNATTTVYVGSF